MHLLEGLAELLGRHAQVLGDLVHRAAVILRVAFGQGHLAGVDVGLEGGALGLVQLAVLVQVVLGEEFGRQRAVAGAAFAVGPCFGSGSAGAVVASSARVLRAKMASRALAAKGELEFHGVLCFVFVLFTSAGGTVRCSSDLGQLTRCRRPHDELGMKPPAGVTKGEETGMNREGAKNANGWQGHSFFAPCLFPGSAFHHGGSSAIHPPGHRLPGTGLPAVLVG
jgi:hypothetical protein